jgi:hypothetical protein
MDRIESVGLIWQICTSARLIPEPFGILGLPQSGVSFPAAYFLLKSRQKPTFAHIFPPRVRAVNITLLPFTTSSTNSAEGYRIQIASTILGRRLLGVSISCSSYAAAGWRPRSHVNFDFFRVSGWSLPHFFPFW